MDNMESFRFLCFFILLTVFLVSCVSTQNRVFEIDFENDQFLKDGEPFRYISGSLHYFRAPQVYWRDRLRKLRAAGLNTVCTYIEWSSHEPKPGVYDFTGDNDIEHFVKLAEEEGLLVILRPGPYICAERDWGGYPPWLLHENASMILRTNDPIQKKHIQKWFSVLMPRLQPLLYGNGGPVIMVQVENEYGSYFACDRTYTLWLRDLFSSYIGTKAVLFTTDGAAQYFLKCGPIPGVFITVDFGSREDVTNAFRPLRRIQPSGPLVNSEFYPGWLTRWGESLSTVDAEGVANSTRDLLVANASFNFYMFFGGTNFGFTSGANIEENGKFLPQITSYDYDAPITEAGDLTEKYFAIRSVISEFLQVPEIPVENSSKMSYGKVTLMPKIALFDSSSGIVYQESKHPKTFEELNQYSGFILYETTLPKNYSYLGYLYAKVHDRALVFVNEKPVGVLSRPESSIIIAGKTSQSLRLLVENQGHINYGNMSFDSKGLVENVTLDGEILTNWKHTGYPLTDVSDIPRLPPAEIVKLPAFFSRRFVLPESVHTPHDTFVDMTGWTKGLVYINGHNLGRYWPANGPQITLYLPGPYLYKSPKRNTVVVMELEKAHPNMTVNFVDAPISI